MSDSLNVLSNEQPWYAKGLHFKCTECGKCCTGAPGYVWISEQEIADIAAYLTISVMEFRKKYLRYAQNRYALIEDPRTYDCVFLKDKQCQVYPVRPKQCRTFPFWPNLVETEEQWNEAATYCEGIRPDAPLIPYSTIKEQLHLEESSST